MLLAGSIVAVLWFGNETRNELRHQEDALLHTGIDNAARELELTLKELHRSIDLFTAGHIKLIEQLVRHPDDYVLADKLVDTAHNIFPESFAVTLVNSEGNLLIEDIDGLVGDVCKADLRKWIQKEPDTIRIHPNPVSYHFDIVRSLPLETNKKVLFFISILTEKITPHLFNHHIQGYQLILLNRKKQGLIEVTEKGGRDVIKREFVLGEKEIDLITYRKHIQGTDWELVALPAQGGYVMPHLKTWKLTLIMMAGLFVFGLLVLKQLVSSETRLIRQTEELNKARITAEEANAAKSRFLSTVNHELRTPLNAIMGFTQLLQMDDKQPLDSAQKDYIDEILKASKHLLELINEVLDLAKIEAGHVDLTIDTVSLSPAIEECYSLVQVLMVENEITLRPVDPACQNLLVRADRKRLKQILLNLLSNAAKYNQVGGSVTVKCLPGNNNRVRISVTDTGQGIAPEHHEKLFEPFNRLEAENSDIVGTGIGLVITRQLVELMGGEMGVESSLGKGSTFWIELPLANATAVASSKIER